MSTEISFELTSEPRKRRVRVSKSIGLGDDRLWFPAQDLIALVDSLARDAAHQQLSTLFCRCLDKGTTYESVTVDELTWVPESVAAQFLSHHGHDLGLV